MEIKLGRVGKIVEGEERGNYVKVVNDEVNTGGWFLVLVAKANDMRDGFDSWVENKQALQRFFDESKWVIDWL